MKRHPATAVALLLLAACQSDPYHGFQSEAYGPPEAANVPLAISEASPAEPGPVASTFEQDEMKEIARRNPWLLDLSADLRRDLLQCIETTVMLDPLHNLPQDPNSRRRREFEIATRSIDQIGAGDITPYASQCPETMQAVTSYL
jgi:hypothetical protein